jgi:hypothetical protein
VSNGRHSTAPVGCTDSASPLRPGTGKGHSPWYFVTQPPGTAPAAASQGRVVAKDASSHESPVQCLLTDYDMPPLPLGAANAKWWETPAEVPVQTQGLPASTPLDVSKKVLVDLCQRRKAPRVSPAQFKGYILAVDL